MVLSIFSYAYLPSKTEVLDFDEVQSICIFFMDLLTLYISSFCLIQVTEVSPMFSFTSIIVLYFTFRSGFHFKLIFI